MYISFTLVTHVVLVLMVLPNFWHQCCLRFFFKRAHPALVLECYESDEMWVRTYLGPAWWASRGRRLRRGRKRQQSQVVADSHAKVQDGAVVAAILASAALLSLRLSFLSLLGDRRGFLTFDLPIVTYSLHPRACSLHRVSPAASFYTQSRLRNFCCVCFLGFARSCGRSETFTKRAILWC
jgi:hypothetical protein